MTTPGSAPVNSMPQNAGGWEQPQRSCGRLCHSLPSGWHYWEAVGPAAQAWMALSDKIRSVVDEAGHADTLFSLHMAMAGLSAQASSPKILVCSKDGQVQVAIRDAILLGGVLGWYPSIGFEFCSNPPEQLARTAPTEHALRGREIPETPTSSRTGVWANAENQEIGRRLYIPGRDQGQSKIATGGPVLFVGSKAYQMTVRHVFSDEAKASSSGAAPLFVADLDLESSGSEYSSDGDSGGDPNEDESRDSLAVEPFPVRHGSIPRHTEAMAGGQGYALSRASPPMPSQALPAGEYGEDGGMARYGTRIGSLAPVPAAGTEAGLDYALVELEVRNGNDGNLVSCGRSGSGKRVRVTKPGQFAVIGLATDVVVVTSSGPVGGKLSSTPALISPRGQRRCQEMYAVRVDEHHLLEPGDCGSAVVETRTGSVFGHVVLGHPGTNVAYILPMEKIIQDIDRTLKQDVRFWPPMEQLSQNAHPASRVFQCLFPWQRSRAVRDMAGTEPHVFVEFGSQRYHENLSGQTMPNRRRLRGLGQTLRESANSSRGLSLSLFTLRQKKNDSFETLFFLLPAEIRNLIIEELPFRCAMNLRQVSKAWRAAVTANASAISRQFLVRNPLPPLARQLYPNQDQDPILQYIQKVGHRHEIASRLASHISMWLTREVYLHKSNYQQWDFRGRRRRMQQRLVPPLFAAVHFFENYPQTLLRHLRGQQRLNNSSNSANIPSNSEHILFERSIMAMHGNDILLQTQHVFEILINFLRWILRPPSYYGLFERLLRGYRRNGPAEEVHAAIFCIGGLDAVVKLADIDDYKQRRAAVDDFVSSLEKPLNTRGSPQSNAGNGETEVSCLIFSCGAGELRPEDLQLLLSNLPPLDDVWRRVGEALLLERKVVRTRRDIMNYGEALTELIRPGVVMADRLYSDGHLLWHALSDHDFGDEDPLVTG